MRVYDEIKAALNEAIEYEKGKVKVKETNMVIIPITHYEPCDIKKIRAQTGLTQKLFAKYMGVSAKTVEAWESGRNHPDGAACRLLSITENNPSFPEQSGIIIA